MFKEKLGLGRSLDTVMFPTWRQVTGFQVFVLHDWWWVLSGLEKVTKELQLCVNHPGSASAHALIYSCYFGLLFVLLNIPVTDSDGFLRAT